MLLKEIIKCIAFSTQLNVQNKFLQSTKPVGENYN